MQAGHGEQVGKSCLGHVRLVRHGQAAPVSGQLRRDKGGGGLIVPDGGDLFPQGPGRPLGQPAQAPGTARLLRHVPLDIQQGEHAPGGEGGHVVFVNAPGILPAGVAGDPLSRLQLGQLLAAVADRLDAPEPLRIHRHPAALLRQLAEVRRDGGKFRLPAAALQHRLLHQGLIPAEIQQSPAEGEQNHRRPQPQLVRQTAAQQHRRQAHCPADDCRPPGPPGPGQQHRRENGGGKGQRYGGQRPHDGSLLRKNFYPYYTRFPVPEQPRRRALRFFPGLVHDSAGSGQTIPVPQVQKEVSVMDKYQNQNQNQNQNNNQNQNQNTRQNRNSKQNQNQNQNQQQNQNQR